MTGLHTRRRQLAQTTTRHRRGPHRELTQFPHRGTQTVLDVPHRYRIHIQVWAAIAHEPSPQGSWRRYTRRPTFPASNVDVRPGQQAPTAPACTPPTVGTDGNVTLQSFDTNGNRTSVTEPSGATTHFTYAETAIVTSVTDALGKTSTNVSDKAGLPLAITDPLGATTCYERDAFGRAVSIINPLGAVTRLQWTVEGKLAHRVEADGSKQSWTYDGEGNCVTHVDVLGGVTTFEYTDFDVLSARTGPDGLRYEFSYDSDLHLTRVTNPQGLNWDYVYDPVGRVTSETDFGDLTLTYERVTAGRRVPDERAWPDHLV